MTSCRHRNKCFLMITDLVSQYETELQWQKFVTDKKKAEFFTESENTAKMKWSTDRKWFMQPIPHNLPTFPGWLIQRRSAQRHAGMRGWDYSAKSGLSCHSLKVLSWACELFIVDGSSGNGKHFQLQANCKMNCAL